MDMQFGLAKGGSCLISEISRGIKEWQDIEQRPEYKQLQLKL